MELKLGDVQTTALIPLAVKANETLRKNARIKDQKAVEIIKASRRRLQLSYAVKSGTQLNREFIADGKMEHGKHLKNCVLKNSMARAIAVHLGDEVRVHTNLASLSVGLAKFVSDFS